MCQYKGEKKFVANISLLKMYNGAISYFILHLLFVSRLSLSIIRTPYKKHNIMVG